MFLLSLHLRLFHKFGHFISLLFVRNTNKEQQRQSLIAGAHDRRSHHLWKWKFTASNRWSNTDACNHKTTQMRRDNAKRASYAHFSVVSHKTKKQTRATDSGFVEEMWAAQTRRKQQQQHAQSEQNSDRRKKST
jgi:hypothetical protein